MSDRLPENGSTKFQTTLTTVLVPVSVRDASGHSVGNLCQDDFQVFDDNKLQVLTSFKVQHQAITSGAGGLAGTEPEKSTPEMVPQATVPSRFVIFLFDDLHLSGNDLVHAQDAAAKMLADSLAKTDAGAVFSISGKTNSGITADTDKLIEAIRSVRAQSVGRSVGHRCPDIDYYQADMIVNKGDELSLKAAVEETKACANLPGNLAETRAHAIASDVLSSGNQISQITLQMIKFVVQKMRTLPGQRILILISPGFPTGNAMSQKSDIINVALEGNVIVSALDARGLYVAGPQAIDSTSSIASPGLLRSKTNYKRNSLSAEGDVMPELAYGTGGTYFHDSNDLAGGFQELTRLPEYLYLLEFAPAS